MERQQYCTHAAAGLPSVLGLVTNRKEVLVLARRVLDEAAFSMRQIADKAGLSYAAVRRWKTGKRAPEPESRLRLAEAFEAHAEHLGELARELRESVEREG